jgi:hypothetical protein
MAFVLFRDHSHNAVCANSFSSPVAVLAGTPGHFQIQEFNPFGILVRLEVTAVGYINGVSRR